MTEPFKKVQYVRKECRLALAFVFKIKTMAVLKDDKDTNKLKSRFSTRLQVLAVGIVPGRGG